MFPNSTISPVDFDKSMFRSMDDVLWLILILWDVPSKNHPGATLAPLAEFTKEIPVFLILDMHVRNK